MSDKLYAGEAHELIEQLAELRAERDALKDLVDKKRIAIMELDHRLDAMHARAERAEVAIYAINTWSSANSVKADYLNWVEFNNLVKPFIKP